MRLFVNGTEVPPAAANIVGDINEPATQTRIIGQYAGIAYSYGWTQGYLDEVRISNVARYTGNFTPPNAPFCNN
jgi:hypothetical protein